MELGGFEPPTSWVRCPSAGFKNARFAGIKTNVRVPGLRQIGTDVRRLSGDSGTFGARVPEQAEDLVGTGRPQHKALSRTLFESPGTATRARGGAAGPRLVAAVNIAAAGLSVAHCCVAWMARRIAVVRRPEESGLRAPRGMSQVGRALLTGIS